MKKEHGYRNLVEHVLAGGSLKTPEIKMQEKRPQARRGIDSAALRCAGIFCLPVKKPAILQL